MMLQLGKGRRILFFLMGMGFLLFVAAGHAEDKNGLKAGGEEATVPVLKPVKVMGELIRPTRQAGDTLYTGTTVTKRGLDLLGTPAQTSVYDALEILPGLDVESEPPPAGAGGFLF